MNPPEAATRSQLVPSLDEVAEALHHNAVERRELQALKRLALARLRTRRTVPEPRREATTGQEGVNVQAPPR